LGAQLKTDVSPTIQLLKQHIENATQSLKQRSSSNEPNGLGSIIYLGNHQDAIPRNLILDPILESGEIHTWALMKVHINTPSMPCSVPSKAHLMEYLKCSRPILTRHLLVLRALRWITLCSDVRGDDGQFIGSVYVQHDAPLNLQDTMFLDTEYLNFLDNAAKGDTLKRLRTIKNLTLKYIEYQIDEGIALDQSPSYLAQISNKLNTVPEININPLDTHLAFPPDIMKSNLVIDLYGKDKKIDCNIRANNINTGKITPVNKSQCAKNITKIKTTRTNKLPSQRVISLDNNINTVVGGSSCINNIKKTTTTNLTELIFPDVFKTSEQLQIFAKKLLKTLSHENQQFCLNYLRDRIKAGDKGMASPVDDAVSYLSWIVTKFKKDELPPSSYGIVTSQKKNEIKRSKEETAEESKQKMRNYYDNNGIKYDHQTLAIVRN